MIQINDFSIHAKLALLLSVLLLATLLFANENDLFTQKVTLESQVRALATDHFHTHRDKRPKPPKQGKAKWI